MSTPQAPIKPRPQHVYQLGGIAVLSYIINIHAEPGLPSGYSAVGKCPWRVDQIVKSPVELSRNELLREVDIPPGGFLIGIYNHITVKYLGREIQTEITPPDPASTFTPK